MQSFHILDVKKFMSLFLLKTDFDDFLLQELEILMGHRILLSGKRNKEWYDREELEELENRGESAYLLWKDIREIAKEMIKGSRTPQLLRGVFYLQEERLRELIAQAGMSREQVQGLAWNLRFENGQLHIVTAASLSVFNLDKTLEQAWDAYMKEFLKQAQVAFE